MSYRVNLASDLRVRGSLSQMGTAPEKDALGQFPAVQQKICDLWCGVVPQTGSLLTGRPAETQLSRTTHKVVIRYRKGVTPDMWLEIRGRGTKYCTSWTPISGMRRWSFSVRLDSNDQKRL